LIWIQYQTVFSFYQIIDQLKMFGITFLQPYTAKFMSMDDSVSVSTISQWVVEEVGLMRVKVLEMSHVECPCILWN